MASSSAINKIQEVDGQLPTYRTLPHNLEAEQALLGAILINNEALNQVATFLEPPHFYLPVHGRILEAILKMIERGQIASPVTLKHYFDNDDSLSDVGGAQYLARLAGSAVTIINAEHYGRAIYDLAMRRQLIGIGEEIEFLNELSGAIVEALTEAKIAHTVQTADVRVVVWDENDEAANEIVEGVLDELFEEFEEDFDLEDLDEEEIEELRAEATAIRVALDAVSISYEIEVDDLGIELPLFDKDNEAAAVRAALDAAGIPDEVENDGFGIGWPLIDEKDEDAWEVIDQPYTTSGANSKSTTTTSRTTKKTKTERC